MRTNKKIFFSQGVDVENPFADWSDRATYTINPDSDQSDFTILIDETNVPANFFSVVKDGGGDIRATSTSNSQYHIEVVECNTSTDKLQLWVRIPFISSASPISIYIYYGNPAAVIDPSFSDAWEPDYTNVFHMEETSGNFIDSTTNNNDMTSQGSLPTPVTGLIGDSQQFNGSTDNGIFTRPVQDDFTLMCFIKSTDIPPSGSTWYAGNGLIDGEVGGTANDFGMSIIDNPAVLVAGVGNPDTHIKGTTQINDGTWHMCVMTRKKSSGVATIYVDGVFETSATLPNTSSLTAPTNLTAGRIMAGGKYFGGEMDEIRISNTDWNAGRIKDVYDSIANRNTFTQLE